MRSKYAIEIFNKILRCDTDFVDKPNVVLEDLYERGEIGLIRDSERLAGVVAEEMFYQMCGALMEDVYRSPTDLDAFLNNYLVRPYMEALSLGEKKEP